MPFIENEYYVDGPLKGTKIQELDLWSDGKRLYELVDHEKHRHLYFLRSRLELKNDNIVQDSPFEGAAIIMYGGIWEHPKADVTPQSVPFHAVDHGLGEPGWQAATSDMIRTFLRNQGLGTPVWIQLYRDHKDILRFCCSQVFHHDSTTEQIDEFVSFVENLRIDNKFRTYLTNIHGSL